MSRSSSVLVHKKYLFNWVLSVSEKLVNIPLEKLNNKVFLAYINTAIEQNE